MSETILEEAQRLVHGDRGDAYGHPIDDFTRTGRMWGAILGIPDVPPERVGLCMAALKLSREVNRSKRDNRVDAAGYVETVDMIHAERERRATGGEPEAMTPEEIMSWLRDAGITPLPTAFPDHADMSCDERR